MKIPAQTIIVINGTTTDYYPDRGVIRSAAHIIYVLSRAEHAKEIKRRFEAIQARLEDITRNEENIQDQTMELEKQDPSKLKSEESTERIKQLQRDEQANREDLERLAREGMKLLEEAMRNKDFSEELLKEWMRMIQGMQVHTTPLAADQYEGIDFQGSFLKQRLTRQLVREEQYLPSAVIDRGSIRTWLQQGGSDTFERAQSRLKALLREYQPPDLPAEQVAELKRMVTTLASEAGMDKLPVLEDA